jgi:hypothetical protein
MLIEGVTYYRYRVAFRLADNRRRRWIRWAPALQYAHEAVARELVERFGIEGIAPHSCTIRQAL